MDQRMYGGAARPVEYPPFEATVNCVIPRGVSFVQLNKSTGALALTVDQITPGNFLIISQVDAGTSGHTVTLPSGCTYGDAGGNDVATFNAAGETLVLFAVSATRFVIVENIGSVALS